MERISASVVLSLEQFALPTAREHLAAPRDIFMLQLYGDGGGEGVGACVSTGI